MQLTLTGHHVEITEALRSYLEKRLERIKRHFDDVLDIHCVFTVEKLEQRAEATVHVSGSTIHAEAVDANLYASIDALVDKLDRSLKKHKEKQQDHHADETRRATRV